MKNKTLQIITFLFVTLTVILFSQKIVVAGKTPNKSLDIAALSNFICLGETVHIRLLDSENGVSYQLKKGTVSIGSPVMGNGGKINFIHIPTSAGNINYQIAATKNHTTVTLTKTITVLVNSGPDLDLSIRSNHSKACKGEGIIVSVFNSDPNYNYQLTKDANNIGVAKIGNGGKLQFQQQIVNDNSTFKVYVNGTGCYHPLQMNKTVDIEVFSKPNINIPVSTNTTTVCLGESVDFIIENSELNTTYNIFSGFSFVSPSIPGNNGTITITSTPDRTSTYKVYAKGKNCILYTELEKEIKITLSEPPKNNLNILSDRTSACAGEPIIISVENSEDGVNYQLTNGTNNIGNPIVGNGATIAFPAHHPIINTTYRVKANRPGCSTTVDLLSSKTITVSPPPNLTLNVIPAKTSLCAGENTTITVENTETDVTYQLTDGTNPIGTAKAGNGSNLIFPVAPTKTILYEVSASKNTCSSSFMLEKDKQITVIPLPNKSIAIQSVPSDICTNESTVIKIDNSETDVSYQLFNSDGNIGAPVNGNGKQLSFSAHHPTTNTTYQVKAIRNSCSTEVQLNNSTDVSIHSLPDITIDYNIDHNSLCKGEPVNLTIQNSQNEVLYEIEGTIDGKLGAITGDGNNKKISFTPNSSQTINLKQTGKYCHSPVTNNKSKIVTVHPSPNLDLKISKNNTDAICEARGDMVTITIENAPNIQQFWLKDNLDQIIDTKTGTGSNLNFKAVSPSTTSQYKIETIPVGCYQRHDLTNKIDVEVIPLPKLDIAVQISEPEVCLNEQTQVSLANSQKNTTYQLFEGTYTQGNAISGTGSAISFPAFTPDRSRTYHIKASHNKCKIDKELNNTVSVTLGIPPDININPSANKNIICQGENVLVSLPKSDKTVSYQLCQRDKNIGTPLQGNSSKLTFPAIQPDHNSSYQIMALGEHCLNAIQIPNEINIQVHHTPEKNKKIIADYDTICSNENVIISINKSQNDVIYQLHNGDRLINQQIIGNGTKIDFPVQTLKADKTFSVYAHEAVCKDPVPMTSSKKITVLNFDPLPVEILATPTEICEGESIDLELPNTIKGVEYILNDHDKEIKRKVSGGNSISFENLIPNKNSKYKISIGNCKNNLTITEADFKLQSNPELQIFTKNVSTGYDGELVIQVKNGTPPFTYIVDPITKITKKERVLELHNLPKGNFDVMVVDLNACKSSKKAKRVEIKTNEVEIIVNNTITPNNDGVNDEWVIQYPSNLGNPEVFVLNIYGQKVFHAKSYENNWKGIYKNKLLPNGAYYYIVKFDSKKIKPIRGTLSILGKY